MIEKVQESHLYMWLKEKDSKFLSKLDETIEYANTILPQINNVFASYTVHGVRHSINVMEYMYALVVDINKLSELEVALLIYSALLHDIGMIANVDEIKEIKADHAILGERKYSKVLEKYGDEMTALQECVRPVHGKRARDYIETKMDERLFLIPESTNISFKSELAQICKRTCIMMKKRDILILMHSISLCYLEYLTIWILMSKEHHYIYINI